MITWHTISQDKRLESCKVNLPEFLIAIKHGKGNGKGRNRTLLILMLVLLKSYSLVHPSTQSIVLPYPLSVSVLPLSISFLHHVFFCWVSAISSCWIICCLTNSIKSLSSAMPTAPICCISLRNTQVLWTPGKSLWPHLITKPAETYTEWPSRKLQLIQQITTVAEPTQSQRHNVLNNVMV